MMRRINEVYGRSIDQAGKKLNCFRLVFISIFRGIATNTIRKQFELLTAITVISGLTACSKTVMWEEDALLNTGKIITVKRYAVYELTGNAGNPLDLAYRPSSKGALQFTIGSKHYLFDLSVAEMVLAISPAGVPAIVAQADSGNWSSLNNYKCTLPFYVQFNYEEKTMQWVWPNSIEPWLYNMPTNLRRERSSIDSTKKRYVSADIAAQGFMHDPQSVSMQKIDPNYTGDLCKSNLVIKER